jgi:hypothetical protein
MSGKLLFNSSRKDYMQVFLVRKSWKPLTNGWPFSMKNSSGWQFSCNTHVTPPEIRVTKLTE